MEKQRKRESEREKTSRGCRDQKYCLFRVSLFRHIIYFWSLAEKKNDYTKMRGLRHITSIPSSPMFFGLEVF